MPRSVDRSPFEQRGATTRSTNSNTKGRGSPIATAEDWAPKFIAALMEGAHINHAARAAGVDVTMPYKRRKVDEEFRLAWVEAAEIGTEELAREGQRRAYHGVDEPVFHKGEICGYVRKYSDTLLMFLLKKRDPTYRDGGEEGGPRGQFVLNVVIQERQADALTAVEQLPTVNIETVDVDEELRRRVRELTIGAEVVDVVQEQG